jgi:hypothetical protein
LFVLLGAPIGWTEGETKIVKVHELQRNDIVRVRAPDVRRCLNGPTQWSNGYTVREVREATTVIINGVRIRRLNVHNDQDQTQEMPRDANVCIYVRLPEPIMSEEQLELLLDGVAQLALHQMSGENTGETTLKGKDNKAVQPTFE